MAKKSDIDKFNIEDLDWPDLDFDEPEEPTNDRSPVTKVAKQAGRGAKKIVFDTQRIKRTAKDVLPGAHSNVAMAGFDVADMMRDAYSQLGDEAYKTKQELQKSLRRFNKQTQGVFGDGKVAKLLKKLGGDEAYYENRESDGERRAREINSDVLAIFGAQREETVEQKKEQDAKSLRTEALNKKRFGSQLAVLASIDAGTKTLVAASETDWRYKRRTLELQLQQNMLMGDMLASLVDLKKSMSEELKAIVKNTALPEAAKIQLTEEFTRINQQKLMESLGGGIYGGLGDYLGRTGRNINKRLLSIVGGKLRDVRMGAGGALDSAGDIIRMQQEQKQYGGEDDTLETIIELAGGVLADKAVGRWGGKVKNRLAQLSLFGNSKGLVDNISTQGARLLNQQAGLRGTRDGLTGKGLDFLRSLLDRTTLDSSLTGVTGGATSDYDEVRLRKMSTRTIVTIIPGLLARIHHEAVKARTGDDSVPMIRFNAETGTFTDSKTLTSAIRNRIATADTAKVNTEAVDRIIDGVVDSKSLTGGQRKLLRNHIAHLNMRQLPFDPQAIASGRMQIFGEGSAKDKVALRRLISSQYGVDRMGNIEGNKDEYHGKVAGAARQIQTLRYNLDDPRKLVTSLIEQGHLEELINIGAVVEKNGQLMIDFDKINEMRFNASVGEGADTLTQAFAPKGMRALGGNVTNNIVNKTLNRNQLSQTSITSQISNRSMAVSGLSGFGADDRYNSQYQSLALEEIIDQLGASGKLGKDSAYNSEYQTTALEEIIDVLERGQEMSLKQMDTLTKAVDQLLNKKSDSEEAYNFQYQTLVLEEIMDILQDGRQFTNIAGTEGAQPGLIARAKGRLRKGLDSLRNTSVMGLARSLKDKAMGRFKTNRERASNLIGRVKNKAKDVWADVRDWYRDGEWHPVLEAKKLAAKKYIDSATNTVVTKLSEVKGDILELMEDGSTQLAVRFEDLKQGLRDGKGRLFVTKKVNQAMDFGRSLRDGFRDRRQKTKDFVLGNLKKGFNAGKNFLFALPDVYVKGEIKPRLLAVLAKANSYTDVLTGNKVRVLNDITGEVQDAQGNTVLSEEDIEKGLVDADGNPLDKYGKGIAGVLNRLRNAPGNLRKAGHRKFRQGKIAVKRGIRKVRNMFRGLGKSLSDIAGGILSPLRGIMNSIGGGGSVEDEHLDVAYAQLEVQGLMLDQLVAANRKGRKRKWDSEGDGIIDGSWRDLLNRRKAKKEAAKEGEGSEKKPSKVISFLKENLFKVAGMIGGVISDLGGLIWDGLKWIGALIAGKAMGGSLGDIFNRGPRRERGGNPNQGGRRNPGGRPGRTPGGRGPGARLPRGKFGAIAGLAASIGLGGFASNAFGGDSDSGAGLSTALDMADMASTATRGQATRTVAQQATRTVATQAGRGLLGRLGLQVGLRAAPLLLNPWVLGGVAVAAAGYGLYKWWDSRKPRPLQAVRLAQYGVDREKGDAAGRYLEFEEWVKKNTRDVDGKVSLQGLDAQQIMEAMEETIGGTQDNPQQAMQWFNYRFMPVYSSWKVAASKVGKSDKLEELDDILTPVQAATVFDRIKGIPSSTRGARLPNADDETMSAAAVGEKIAEIGKKINADSLGVKEGDNSASGVAKAVAASSLATMSGNESVIPGTAGRMIGFLGEANPAIKGALMGINAFGAGIKQYFSGSDQGDYNELKIDKGPVDALRSVRMKVYGLTEMSLPLVNAIIRLECQLNSGVKYSGKGTAVYRGDARSAMESVMGSFSVDTRDSHAYPNFVGWFENRFMPAYLAYMGAAHEAGLAKPLRAHLNGTMTQQYFAANAMVAASTLKGSESISVWKTGLHPTITGAGNRNPGSVTGNMETLLAKVDQSELSEISGEKGGILSKAEKLIESFTGKVSQMKNSLIRGATSWMPEGIGNKVRSFFGADGPGFSGGPTPSTPVSPMNTPGGAYTPTIGGGAQVNFDPAGGKYGNVNDVPLPTGPKGFEAHMALIEAVSKMTGVDPGVLAGLFATESSFDSSAKPGTSSAKGLGQFIDSTWKAMVKKYGHLFGIKEGTSPNDPRANALMTVMYMKDNAESLKKSLGKNDVTDVDLYLAHFLGSGGYAKLYKNPNEIAARLLPDSARANASIFYDGGRARTAAEVMAIQANKQIKNRNHYGPLMHAYVKQNGGTVDSSIFASKGAEMGAIAQGPAQGAATTSDASTTGDQGLDDLGAPKLPENNLVSVDAGGMPTAPQAPMTTGAQAVRTSAAAGGDVTAPPPTSNSTTSTAEATQANVQRTTEQQQSSANTQMVNDKVGNELVRLGGEQVSLLKTISEGIQVLVQQGQAPTNSKAINGEPRGPMGTTKASSV